MGRNGGIGVTQLGTGLGGTGAIGYAQHEMDTAWGADGLDMGSALSNETGLSWQGRVHFVCFFFDFLT